jgi:tagatose 6-phosphate kinase
MILCITLNPIIDKILKVDKFRQGGSVHSTEINLFGGGKGNNIARVLNGLGLDVLAFNLLGGFEGSQLKAILEAGGIKNDEFTIKGRTRIHNFILEEDSGRLTDIYEPSPEITAEEKILILQKIKDIIKISEFVVISGSSPCQIAEDIFFETVFAAKKHGLKTIVDTSGNAFKIALKARPFLIKPNKEETEEIINKKINSQKDVISALDFFESEDIKISVISMGRMGAYIRHEGRTYKAQTPDIAAANSFGSGDCMVAGFIKGILQDMPIEKIIKVGMAAGTANAVKTDIATIDEKDINKYMPQIKVELIKS